MRGKTVGRLSGETMGTGWTVAFVGVAGLGRNEVRRRIVARLDTIVREMSHWEADSLLSRYNRAPAGERVLLPPDFAYVMAGALRLAAGSDGAFDPTLGRLSDLWGFGPAGPRPAPTEAALAAARRDAGWRRLGLEGDALLQPGGLALDLSGIAKGHAVDAVADALSALGIRHFLVEIGGELRGHGIRPDHQPWWVDLETPPGLLLPPIRVALHGLAVATSGNYRRGDHTLDPRTGRPVDNPVVSASVIAGTAMEADAWATALTVLGVERGLALADRTGLAARLVTRAGEEGLSAALRRMLDG